jgi:hypothetical protein
MADAFRPVFEGMKQVADGLIQASDGLIHANQAICAMRDRHDRGGSQDRRQKSGAAPVLPLRQIRWS